MLLAIYGFNLRPLAEIGFKIEPMGTLPHSRDSLLWCLMATLESLGVGERFVGEEKGRLSYVLWEENNITHIGIRIILKPIIRNKYEDKQSKYAQLGILQRYAIMRRSP